MVLSEAMACGKPVVTTEIVGIAKDVKEGNCGKIVEPKTVNALADAIIEVLQDKKGAKRIGANGTPALADNLAELILTLIDGKRRMRNISSIRKREDKQI